MFLPRNEREGVIEPESSRAEGDGWCLDDLGPFERRGSKLDGAPGLKEEQIGLAAFTCALLILGFADTGLVLRDFYPPPAHMEMSDCVGIDSSTERLACYDRLALEQVTEPARGAAPQLSSTH